MSRSTKKPILKDKPRNYKRTSMYWRKVRRITANKLRTYSYHLGSNLQDIDEPFLPQPREIFNDWDYCDWVIQAHDPKYSRK